MRIIACAGAVLAAASPASAGRNDYGGYDIVGRPNGESLYADMAGWRVLAATDGSAFAYCVAETTRDDGSRLRLGWDGQQWQLAVPVKARPDWEGTLQIDGEGSGRGYRSGGDNISGSAAAGWTIAWLGLAELDGLRKGSTAVLGVGKLDFDFSLSGATAASLKVEECVARSGKVATPAVATAGPAVTAFGKSGSWIINELRQGRRTVACEASDPAGNPNLRFEIDRDNAYVDFRDGSDMGRPGEQVAIEVRFGPGSDPTNASAAIITGRDGATWARITEGRNDGPGLLDDAIPNANQVSFIGKGILLETHLSGSNKALDVFFRCSDKIK